MGWFWLFLAVDLAQFPYNDTAHSLASVIFIVFMARPTIKSSSWGALRRRLRGSSKKKEYKRKKMEDRCVIVTLSIIVLALSRWSEWFVGNNFRLSHSPLKVTHFY